MSNMKFAAGVILAGVLAFGLVLTAYQLTSPVFASVESGPAKTPDVTLGERPHADSPVGEGEDPEDLLPPNAALLIGVWKAKAPSNQDAFVMFTKQGTWQASDGCNELTGDWQLDMDGSFDGGEGGPMTLIGCDNVNIPQAVMDATSIQVSLNELTFSGTNGEKLELVRVQAD